MFSVSFLPNCLRFPLSYSYTCTTVLFWLCDQLEIVLYINRIIHVHVCIMLFICYKSLGTIKYIKTKPVYNLLLITSALCAFWRRLHNQSFICMYVPGMKHRFLKGEPEVAKPKISNNSCRYEGGDYNGIWFIWNNWPFLLCNVLIDNKQFTHFFSVYMKYIKLSKNAFFYLC